MQGIRIGVGIGDGQRGVPAMLQQVQRAEVAGFQSAWIANIFGADAMTVAAVAAAATVQIEIGTAVVPTHSRHPVYMAQQALTTQAACGGRFTLGLGPSHKVVIENVLGLSFARPALHVREYARILRDLIDTGKSNFEGQVYRVNASLSISGSVPVPILLGALQPQMRRIAGTLCDGTITWMTGPRVIGEQLAPEIGKIAREAGRPAPRIVCGLPISVTSDVEGAREAAARGFAGYGNLPSYRAMLDAEGARTPGDVLLAGDESEIERGIERLRSAGVTDFNASIFPHGEDRNEAASRTWDLLAELARRGRTD